MAQKFEVNDKLEEIFMPYADMKRKEVLKKPDRLVHYTTAENAINIIRTKCLWLRNARGMQDFSEVEYGYSQLHDYFQNKDNLNAFDGCGENVTRDAITSFNQWWGHIQTSSYISCFSEHGITEDLHGRLSMWRAFGRNTTGVAIVINIPEPYAALPLKVMLSAVAYFTKDELLQEFNEVINRINSNQDFLKSLDRQMLVNFVYIMLMMATVSLKHPGFHEEREWRLVYFPTQSASSYISSATEVIAGIPQVVHKLSLENKPNEGITGIELPQLVDRVIIGPTQYASPIWQSLVRELTAVGVANAAEKVIASGIPLRS
jgi:hypothetical protein